ncbi:MAG: hypothetical protein BYD32DRAFT_455366 [Podila humilis]|nr:MAG: hypothetical protein BYD32DRAFT_455366 [Podila humilis]
MTDTSGFGPTQRSKSFPDGSIIIKDKVDGSLHTFNMVVDGTKRVQCKDCGAKIGKKHATRHYDSHQARKNATLDLTRTGVSIPQGRGSNGHLELLEVSTTTASSIAASYTYHRQDPGLTAQPPDQEVDGQLHPKMPRALLKTGANVQRATKEENEQQKRCLIKAFCGDLPVEMMLTTAKCARLKPYLLHGPGVKSASFISEGAANLLRALVPQGHYLSLYPLCNSNDISNHPTVPDGYEDALNQDHIEVMTQGGTSGMERLIGAIVATGDNQTKIICTEHYLRDRAQDPHAESIRTHHTSVPDDQSTSQYPKALKIVTIPDRFNNPHFVIGTSAGNYLVTASEEDSRINVGLGRCGAFKVSEHTRLLISRERQDQSLLDNTVFGLAQVRTGFGHPTTYTTRRAIAEEQNDLETMPVTIFTLHRWKVPGAKVFHQLYVRSLEKHPNGIILRRSDVDDSPLEGKIAQSLAEFLELFVDNELNVTGTPKAEDILQALANLFSKVISDMNRVISDNIEKRKIASML